MIWICIITAIHLRNRRNGLKLNLKSPWTYFISGIIPTYLIKKLYSKESI